MRNVQFMVLTGHLNEFPLPSLIKTLHGQRKTGRLQVEYSESPGAFYFEQGRLADARLGELRGLEALLMALSLPDASFNFNPLIKPPETTFAEPEQRLIRDLLDAPTGEALEAPALPAVAASSSPVARTNALGPSNVVGQLALPPPSEEHLVSEVRALLDSHSRRFSRERAVYAVVIAALLLVTVATLLRGGPAPATVAEKTVAEKIADPGTAPAATGESARHDAARESSAASQPQTVTPLAREGAGVRGQQTVSNGARLAGGGERAGRKSKPAAAVSDKAEAGDGRGGREARPSANSEQVVSVIMQVGGGRVLQAKVQNSRPGMESYEALALRMARQRRYPEAFSGQDTFHLRVKP